MPSAPDERLLRAFARGALREALQDDGAPLPPRTKILLARVADGLALADAAAAIPPMAETETRTTHRALLTRAIAALADHGLPLPAEAQHLTDDAPLPTLTAAISACLATLAAAGAPAAATLAAESFAAEQAARRHVNAALAAVTAQTERATDPPPRPIHAADLQALIRASGVNPGVTIEPVRPLFTHSSKQAFVVHTDGAGGWPRQAILRREPAFSIVESSLADEHDVLRAVHDAGLPVPAPLFAGDDPAALGGRFILMAFAPGKPETVATLGPAVAPLLDEVAGFLASLHRVDPRAVPRLAPAADRPLRPQIRARIDRIYATWVADRTEPSLMIEAAFAWLRGHVDTLSEDPVIVHGDYDLRNILVADGRIGAVVDWEMSRLGHRAEDLGYIRHEAQRSIGWDAFIAAYHAKAPPVCAEAVTFFEILAWTWRLTVVVTAYSGFTRGAHTDLLLASTRMVEYEEHLDRLAEAMGRV